MQSVVQLIVHCASILMPNTIVLKEAIAALNATYGGIETYPLCEYVLHSLFLKMTGAQEQKLKCICWELACRDYEYRYERYERERYSECSSYKDKSMVYKDLIDEIQKREETFAVDVPLRQRIIAEWKNEVETLLEKSLLAECFKNRYVEYKQLVASIGHNWIMENGQLLTNKSNVPANERSATCDMALQELFVKYVYNERNRAAHNTRSYQHNIPTLRSMTAPEHICQNYFLFLSIMILLDKIYIELFQTYLSKL